MQFYFLELHKWKGVKQMNSYFIEAKTTILYPYYKCPVYRTDLPGQAEDRFLEDIRETAKGHVLHAGTVTALNSQVKDVSLEGVLDLSVKLEIGYLIKSCSHFEADIDLPTEDFIGEPDIEDEENTGYDIEERDENEFCEVNASLTEFRTETFLVEAVDEKTAIQSLGKYILTEYNT